ncbi:hypothetical protein ACLOJK_010917 [Asimina triloba]
MWVKIAIRVSVEGPWYFFQPRGNGQKPKRSGPRALRLSAYPASLYRCHVISLSLSPPCFYKYSFPIRFHEFQPPPLQFLLSFTSQPFSSCASFPLRLISRSRSRSRSRTTDPLSAMPLQTPSRKKSPAKIPETRWKSFSQERIYGQKLLEAIEKTKNPSQPSNLAQARAIKLAADSALALTAKGQTRWSRAILRRRWQKRRLWLKAKGKISRRSTPRPPEQPAARAQALQVLQQQQQQTPQKKTGQSMGDRLRVLSRLVPGCRKLSAPLLLEEAADYVAALEMQVKAMRALADLLSAARTSSTTEPRDT